MKTAQSKMDNQSYTDIVFLRKQQARSSPEDHLETEVSFKDVIFIPFKEPVAYTFLLVNYISMLFYIYLIGYKAEIDEYLIMAIIIEVICVCHTALIILHRLMKSHSIKRYHQSASLFTITVDVIVLVPMGSITTILDRFTWNVLAYTKDAYEISHYVKLLRIIRIFLFFREYKSNLKLNRKVTLPLIHFIISTLFTSMTAVIYYKYACFGCDVPNWSNRLKDFNFDPYNSIHWAMICNFCTYTLQLQNANSLLINVTSTEFGTAAIILLVGFVVQFMFLTGSLISEYIYRMKFKFQFEHKVANVRSYLQTHGMSGSVQKEVRKYYEEVWNTRKGLIMMPSNYKLFPPEFQMEIRTDIFWEAILHTHIFALFDNSFKKELSTVMKTEILLPDQYIYSVGSVRSKMIYLVSGILELMSPEDFSSPIMSFSPGTVLGETACIVPTISSAIVRSATICEIHILEHRRLATLMKKYAYLHKTLHRILLRRIWFAKIKRENLAKINDSITHIFWIKSQWRRLLKLGLGHKEDESLIYNNYHTSRFLDLIVLSTQDELKVGAICIKGSCSFVLEYDSTFRQCWDYFSLSTIVFQVFITAHMVFYKGEFSLAASVIILFFDLVYALDVYVQSITAVNVHGVLISKPSEVFLHRTKQITFMFDVAAALPIDHILSFYGADHYLTALCRIIKFLKTYKVFEFLMMKQNLLSANVITYQFARTICQHSIIVILLVGLMYTISCYKGICDPTGWIAYSESVEEVPVHKYLKAIYHTAAIYFSMNISKLQPTNINDLVVQTLVYVIGYYMCAFSFVSLCSAFALKCEEGFSFDLKIDKLESIFRERKELLPYKQTIVEYAKHQYQADKSITIDDVCTVMDQESAFLSRIIRKQFLMKILQQLRLFEGCNEEFLERLAGTMKIYSIPAGSLLVQPGVACFHLHIILKGLCMGISYAPGDMERGNLWKCLTKYETFPLIAVLHKIQSFCKIKTATACQIACIPYLEMTEIIRASPMEHNTFMKTLKWHRITYGNLLSRKEMSYFTKRFMGDTLGSVDTFRYQIFQESVGVDKDKNYLNLALEKYRMLIHKLIWKTYDPNGNFVIYYEAIRGAIVCLHILQIQLSLSPSFFNEIGHYCVFMIFVMQYYCVVDFYIGAHYQYYNNLGIKVTHPLWTCKHYFSTSFLLDLIGNFPVSFFQLNHLISPKNTIMAYIYILMFTRPFLLYRPYMLINYLEKNISNRLCFMIKLIKISIYGIIFTAQLSCIQILYNCPISEDVNYQCNTDSWITQALDIYTWNNLFFVSFYSILTLTSIASFPMFSNTDHLLTLILALLVFFCKIVYFCRIVGNSVFENSKLSNYQDGISHYREFIKIHCVSDSNTDELLEHYMNLWKKSEGEVPSAVFEFLYPLLRTEVCSTMYLPKLLLCPIWSNDESFLGFLSTHLQERHFKKGAEIIRCNDVQDEVFIVYKGAVDVSMAGMVLDTLEPGGVFGCFQKLGSTRQTLSVTARVHICLLCIKTTKLYKIARLFPKINQTLHVLQFDKSEFVPFMDRDIATVSMSHVTERSQDWRRHFFMKTIKENKSYYVVWKYLASVHVAALSSILCLFFIVVGKFTIVPLWITLDIYYLIDIYFKTHARYIDLESGVTVTDIFQILQNYLKSYMLYVDLITIIPFYLLTFIPNNIHIRPVYYISNKLLRIVYLWNYYWQHVLKKNVPRHIRWTFVLYLTMFLIQLIFALWWLVVYEGTVITFNSISSTYLHVMNILTNAGLHEAQIQTVQVLVINLILLCVSHFLSMYLLIVVSRMLLVQNNHIAYYKLGTELLESYFRQMQASSCIVDKAWNYLIYLYRRQKGEQMPRLLKEAPPYIRQDHLKTLFGKEFDEHFIFYNAHCDFLRQIYMHVNMSIYLPDDTIVESGDINGTLYFIDEGTVLTIEAFMENKYIFGTLIKGEWFGDVQGILSVPHDKSYRAVTVCSIMSLRKSDWEYLLKWFPATEETLFELARISHDAR